MSRHATYGTVSRLNHWLIAVAMIGMLGFGLYLGFADLSREVRGPLMGIHKSVGVLVLIYGLWRVGWRIVKGFPTHASTMPKMQKMAASAAHWALMAGILLLPVSGIFASIFRGRAVDVFGWFAIPAQAEVAWLADAASGMHSYVGIGLSVLVILHIIAALKHHFIDRDDTLLRMLPGQANQTNG